MKTIWLGKMLLNVIKGGNSSKRIIFSLSNNLSSLHLYFLSCYKWIFARFCACFFPEQKWFIRENLRLGKASRDHNMINDIGQKGEGLFWYYFFWKSLLFASFLRNSVFHRYSKSTSLITKTSPHQDLFCKTDLRTNVFKFNCVDSCLCQMCTFCCVIVRFLSQSFCYSTLTCMLNGAWSPKGISVVSHIINKYN